MGDSLTRMSHISTGQTQVSGILHWSPESQRYTTADVLLQFLRDAWTLRRNVIVETFGCSSYRRVSVYRFVLQKGSRRIELPIIENPVVHRLILQYELAALEEPFPEEMPV
jgi:hypothetical protein